MVEMPQASREPMKFGQLDTVGLTQIPFHPLRRQVASAISALPVQRCTEAQDLVGEKG